jgi:hypothetical protein
MLHKVLVNRVVWYKYTDVSEEHAVAISKTKGDIKSFPRIISKFESDSITSQKKLLYVI